MARTPSRPQNDNGSSLNPGLRRDVDREFGENQNGSVPMESVSIKNNGPAVWPVIWAVVVIGLSALTLWLIFG
ncbi:MAG TPA: hypothetical protein VIO94_06895 [Phenylobacterium sp.]